MLPNIARALSPQRLRAAFGPGEPEAPQDNPPQEDPQGAPHLEENPHQGEPQGAPHIEEDPQQDAPQRDAGPHEWAEQEEPPRVLVQGAVIGPGLVVPGPPPGPHSQDDRAPPGPPPYPRPEGLDDHGRPLAAPQWEEPLATAEVASGSNATQVRRRDPHWNEIHWWETSVQEPQEPVTRRQLEEQRGPRHGDWMTLEWMRYLKDPHFEWFEWHHKKALHKALTEWWVYIQGGSDYDTSKYIWEVFQLLELDRKAIRDLMLLAHAGVVGRTAFNEIMWALLSEHGLQKEYWDLSRKASSMVQWKRRAFDRPPVTSPDRLIWSWKFLSEPEHDAWHPQNVPQGAWTIKRGPRGRPLPPPECYGDAAPLKGKGKGKK